MQTFSEKLEELLEEKDISQAELSRRIGSSVASIAFYASGYTEPKADFLIGIADVFGVSIDYLMGRTNRREMRH